MECVQSSVKEAFSHTDFLAVLDKLLLEGMSREDVHSYFSSSSISFYKVLKNGTLVGFYTLEDVGDCQCESHAYVFEQNRQSSMDFLKLIISEVGKMKMTLLTSVTGDYPHVLRLLKMLGFSVVREDKGVVHRNGGTFSLFHLIKKEDS